VSSIYELRITIYGVMVGPSVSLVRMHPVSTDGVEDNRARRSRNSMAPIDGRIVSLVQMRRMRRMRSASTGGVEDNRARRSRNSVASIDAVNRKS